MSSVGGCDTASSPHAFFGVCMTGCLLLFCPYEGASLSVSAVVKKACMGDLVAVAPCYLVIVSSV